MFSFRFNNEEIIRIFLLIIHHSISTAPAHNILLCLQQKPLFYASKVLNIHYTYLLEVAKFMHDFTRRKLPTPLLNFFSSNLTVHKHNTRQVLDPHFSIIYNSIAEKSIIHRGPRIWSNIPQPIKECETKNSFNKLLKRHFLTNQEHLS